MAQIHEIHCMFCACRWALAQFVGKIDLDDQTFVCLIVLCIKSHVPFKVAVAADHDLKLVWNEKKCQNFKNFHSGWKRQNGRSATVEAA